MVWHTYHSLACLPQLGIITTALLANTTAWATIPPLVSSPFIIYSSHSTILLAIIQAAANSSLPSSSTLYPSCHIAFYNLPLSVTWRATLTISQSMLIFSPRLIRNYPYSRLYPYHHAHQHCSHHVILYNFPLSLRELREQSHEVCQSSYRISFTILITAGINLTTILIHIVLIVSYCTTSYCHLESCANNITKQVDLLAASYSRLSLKPASCSPPCSSTSYSLCRIVHLPTVT